MQNDEVKLAACPFCGILAERHNEGSYFWWEHGRPGAMDDAAYDCPAIGFRASEHSENGRNKLAAWNRRAIPSTGGGEPVAAAPTGKWHDIEYLMAIIDSAIEDGFDPDEDGPVLDEVRAEVAAGLHRPPSPANPAETQAVEVGK